MKDFTGRNIKVGNQLYGFHDVKYSKAQKGIYIVTKVKENSIIAIDKNYNIVSIFETSNYIITDKIGKMWDYKKVYKKLKLENVTTKQQKKNGSIEFKDTIIKTHNPIHYTFHKSGYYRRVIKYGLYRFGSLYFIRYQLNPKNVYNERIKIKNINNQMAKALGPILNYRENN